MKERQTLHRKRCELCKRLRHRDEMLLVPLSKTRIVETDSRSGWLCFFCFEALRKAADRAGAAFEAWRLRRAA